MNTRISPVVRADTAAIGATAAGTAVLDQGALRDVGQAIPWRWLAMTVFVLATALNFLDRQLLAAVAPTLRSEFNLSNADYGRIIAAFSLTYLFTAPLAGWFVDRVGLNRGIVLGVGLWSLASVATGFVGSFRGLIACRMALGVAEAPGIPIGSKSSAVYLRPREVGVGIAYHAIGVSAGMMAAPLIVAAVAPSFGWRSVFIVCGILGFVWIPLFLLMSRKIPAASAPSTESPFTTGAVIRDLRLWAVLAANTLVMVTHSLWMNWTTIYFVEQHQLTQTEANQYFAWIPPVFATLGGLFGGWLALRQIDKRGDPVRARLRNCYVIGPMLLVTSLVPLMATPSMAAAAISLSFFLVMAFLNNLQVIPIDLFGAGRAAFTAALLASSYALIQTVLSPAMGALVDNAGFGVLCVAVSILPLFALVVLRATFRVTTA